MAKARDSKGQFVSGATTTRGGDGMSHLTLNAIVGQAVHNAQYSQPRGGSNTHGGSPRRDIDDECGFPKRGLIKLEDYTYLFERCSIAARVVELEPREAWKASPSVYEDEDSETVTKFEEGLNELGKKLQGESWFETGEDESGSVIWQKLQLIDELSGIGSFGALLLGLDDSDDLSEPAPGIKDDGTSGGGGENTTRELLYLRAYSQTMVKIDGYVTEKSNPRYGLPEYYSIQVAGYDTSSVNSGNLPDTSEIRVHWSRVIHVADIWHQSSASDVFAIPRMRPVYNEVVSCRKIAGASGEFYWNHGSRDLIIETHPQLGGKVRFPSDMKSQIEQFETGLQRSLRLSGASAKTLNPAVSDPTPHLMIQVKLICIKKGCPERIFWGSERGELASSQDERGWADRVMGRQNGYVTPRIIVPFINRCIQLGVLPKPEQYYVVWPNLRELSPQERAVVVAARVEAMVKYVGGNVYQVMAPADFLTRELDYTQEETVEILKAAQEEEEDMLEKQKALQPEPKFGEEGEQPPGQGKGKKKEDKEGDGEKKEEPTTHAYNPSQPRDAQGKFGSGGGGGGGGGAKPTREEVVESLAKKQIELGQGSSDALTYADKTAGRTFTKLEEKPWQTSDELTAKDRQGKRDITQTSRQLKEMTDEGFTKTAWDREGNAYHAVAGEELPSWLSQSSNDADLVGLPPRVLSSKSSTPFAKPSRKGVVKSPEPKTVRFRGGMRGTASEMGFEVDVDAQGIITKVGGFRTSKSKGMAPHVGQTLASFKQSAARAGGSVSTLRTKKPDAGGG